MLRFARLQAAGGALTQAVHRGAAPACALLGVGAAATGHAAIAAGAALAITYAVMQTTLVALPGAARAYARDRRGAPRRSLRRVAALSPRSSSCRPARCSRSRPSRCSPPRSATSSATRRRALRIALAAAALAPLWALATQLAALRERPGASLAGAAAGAATFVAVALLALPVAGAGGAAAAMLAGVAATTAGDVRGAAAAHVISVVVPTRDRPEALARCLAALAWQRAQLEIIVVDDGDAGGAGAPGARVDRAPAARGPAAARNLGARAARGDVVCFTDDDCAPAPRLGAAPRRRLRGRRRGRRRDVADPAAGRAAAAAQLLTNTLSSSTRDRATRRGWLRADLQPRLPRRDAARAAVRRVASRSPPARTATGARGSSRRAALRHVPEAAVVHRPQLGVARARAPAAALRPRRGRLPRRRRRARRRRLLPRARARDAAAGARTARLVALAQASVAAGAARATAEQRLAR